MRDEDVVVATLATLAALIRIVAPDIYPHPLTQTQTNKEGEKL